MTFPWEHYLTLREREISAYIQTLIEANPGMTAEEIERTINEKLAAYTPPPIIEVEPEPEADPPVIIIVPVPEPESPAATPPEPELEPESEPEPESPTATPPNPEPEEKTPKRNLGWWHRPVTFGK